MRSGQNRKHSVAGPGGTSSQSAAGGAGKGGYTLYGGEKRRLQREVLSQDHHQLI